MERLARRLGRALGRARPGAPQQPPRRQERDFLPAAQASALEQQLRPFARRLRRRRTLEQMPRALLLAAAIAAAAAAAARLFGLPGLLWLGAAAAVVTFVGSTAAVLRRPIGPLETARYTDAALALRERLATALELLDTGASGALVHRQIRDATAAARAAAPGQAFPCFAPGSESRRAALRTCGYAALALAGAVALAVWPAAGTGLIPLDEGQKLALADPGRREDSIVRPETLRPPREEGNPDAVPGRTDRPNEVGELPGQVGAQQNNQQRAQAGEQEQPNASQGAQAQQDAQRQQNASIADRQQALQELGNALRQSQTAKQAGEALRQGDTQRAGQQLNQVADQVNRLSPGERQSLSQAFGQASQQIGEKDRPLADAARRAGEALSAFRNQEAQQAIREAANQVRDTGRQVQEQRDLAQRAQELQRGGQPQLPEGQGRQQPGQPGQQPGQGAGAQSGQQGPQGQSGQQPRQGGEGAAAGGDLSDVEAALRGGGLQGAAAGQGAGAGEGAGGQSAPHRLNVEARTVHVDAEVREGPSQWRPPSPNAAPLAPPPAAGAVPTGPASAAPIGAGLDINSVPRELADPVREYFTQEQPKP